MSGPDTPGADGPSPDAMLSGLIFDAMITDVAGPIGAVFTEYAERHRTDKWLLFSDYVLGDRNRP